MHSGLDPGDYQIGPRCGCRMHSCLDAISACLGGREKKARRKGKRIMLNGFTALNLPIQPWRSDKFSALCCSNKNQSGNQLKNIGYAEGRKETQSNWSLFSRDCKHDGVIR